MSLRDSIKDDFSALADDLETVTLFRRSDRSPGAVCAHAKRSVQSDKRQAIDSLGFAVSDFVVFQIATDDLSRVREPVLGDWLVDGAGRRYAISSIFHSRMTDRYRLTTVSLQEVFGSVVDVLVRSGNTETGGPGEPTIAKFRAVPARVWPVDQSAADFMGDSLRPRYRCAFFADGRQISLPITRRGDNVLIRTEDGTTYDVTDVRSLDQLVGFAVLDMVETTDRRTPYAPPTRPGKEL